MSYKVIIIIIIMLALLFMDWLAVHNIANKEDGLIFEYLTIIISILFFTGISFWLRRSNRS
ncbi:MAG: hypothetical protein V1838_02585 [Patescibacteria group bacterium]